MARLPVPGSDDGTWGTVLNDFLNVAHNADGTLKSGSTSSAGAEQTSNKGAANGYASLDGSGKVPTSQLPTTSTGVQTVSAADSTITIGGTSADPTISVGAISESQVTNLTSDLTGKAPTTRIITAGTGLTGGGDLSVDRTISANFGTSAGTIVQGNDSRITGAVQSSIVTTKGDLLAATAVSTIARVGVGTDGQVLTADSAQTAGLKWATPTAGSSLPAMPGFYPASAYGFSVLSIDPTVAISNESMDADTILVARLWIPANTVINGVGVYVQTAGSAPLGTGTNGFAIYEDDGTQAGTTTSDDALFQTTGWVTKALVSPVAAQASDRFVLVAMLFNYTNAPRTMWGSRTETALNGGNAVANRRSLYLAGVTSFPASINPATYGNLNDQTPLIGLS